MAQRLEVLGSKIRPPRIGVPLLARPRLLHPLMEALRKSLIIISAEAGYGKTSLMLSALPDLTAPIAWLTVDESDIDLNLFASGLVAAICAVVPEFGEDVLQVLTTGPSAAVLRQRILAACEQLPPLVIVLDDFHAVDPSDEVLDLMDHLASHLPPAVHMIVATRTSPRLRTLPKLLVQGQAAVLEKAWLRFSADETSAFLQHSHGIEVSDDHARRLAERTEGWPAAIQLAALASRERGSVALEGTPREIFDYLAATVLDTLPMAMQMFLMRTSLLSELWPSLCAAISDEPDAAAVLAELERSNLFVYRLDDAGTRFRYHQLFSEFLRQRLGIREPDRVRDLHRAAARHLESENLPDQALRHYVAAEAYDEAERVMKPLHGVVLTARLAYLIRDLVNRLPDRLLDEYPWITRCGASACRYVGDYNRALALAQRAMQAAEGRDPNLWAFSVHGTAVMYSYMDRFADAIKLCRDALARHDTGVEDQWIGAIYSVLADCLIRHGDLLEAEQAVNELGRLTEVGFRPGKGLAPALLSGLIALTRQQYGRAAQFLRESLQHAEARGSVTYQVAVLIEMVRLEIARGRRNNGFALLKRAKDLHTQTGERAADLHLTHLEAASHLLHGNLSAAETGFQQALTKCRPEEGQEPKIWALLGLAEIARGRGQLPEAEWLVQAAMSECHARGIGMLLPILYLERVGLLQASGRLDEALPLLAQAKEVYRRWASAPGLVRCGLFEASLYWRRSGSPSIPIESSIALGMVLQADNETVDDAMPFLRTHATWVVPLLVAALPDPELHDKAAPLVVSIGEAAVPALLDVLPQHAQPTDIVTLLGHIGDPRARRPIERLRAQMPEIRAAADDALRRLRRPEPVTLRIRLLGPFEVYRASEPVSDAEWKTQKVKALFKYLIQSRDRPVHREQVIDLLWSDAEPDAGRANLKTAVKHLRQALEPLLEGTESHFIQRSGPHLRFLANRCWIDVQEYEQLVDDARRKIAEGHDGDARTALEHAATLYRGDFLEDDPYAEWAVLERERLRELHIDALSTLARLYAQQASLPRAIETIRRVLAVDRLRENAHRDLIAYLLKAGDRTAALDAYHACERVLREELGVTPQPETAALYEQARSAAPV